MQQQRVDIAAKGTAHEQRIEKLETAASHEREVCDAKLSSLRHELRNVAANFDGVLLAIKYARRPGRAPAARAAGALAGTRSVAAPALQQEADKLLSAAPNTPSVG